MVGNANSGNPNPVQTDEFKEARQATQLGSANNPNHYSKDPARNRPWSVRNSIRYYGAKEADPDDSKALKDILTENGKRKPTLAQMAAMALIKKATAGDVRAIETMTDQIDGKLLQPTMNADIDAIRNMNDEELDALIQQFDGKADPRAGANGTPETPGSQGENAETGSADKPTGDTAGV